MALLLRMCAIGMSVALAWPALAADEAGKAALDKVASQAPAGEPINLNLKDPTQYAFFQQQLMNAGFTPERYPQLYRATETASHKEAPLTRRVRLLQEKSAPALLAASAAPATALQNSPDLRMLSAAALPPAAVPIQTFTTVGSPDNKSYSVTAVSSVPGKPAFSMLALSLYDKTGKLVGSPGRATSATASATLLKATATATLPEAGSVQAVATWMVQDAAGTVSHGANIAMLSSFPTEIRNDAPMANPGQPVIKICLGRSGTDCTYSPAGGSGYNVLLPMKGHISFNSAISQDPNSRSAMITLVNPDPGTGGGCVLASTDDFFAPAYTTISGNTISWNLDPAHFPPAWGCLTPNSTAIYTLVLGLQVGERDTYVAITSEQGAADPSTFHTAPLEVWFSCLATGTQVTLADGKPRRIENIQGGTNVRTGPSSTSKVVNPLVGREEAPMVTLATSDGHKLMLTEGHPVITTSGVVLARSLKPGQRVMTQTGSAELIEVGRKFYKGNVWNLNLGEQDRSPGNALGSTFYANGILVGDHAMQFAENRRQQHEAARASLPDVPDEWHTDVVNAIKDDPHP